MLTNPSNSHANWRRITGAALLDLAFSTLYVWNIFVDPLTHHFGISITEANYVFALGLVTFSFGVIMGGRWADTIAPRWLAIVSGLGMFFGLILAATAPSFIWVVLGFGVLQGGAAGLGYATAVHEAALINRGLVLALIVSAYGVGSAALAWPTAWLLAAFGYGTAFTALAVFAALSCGVAASLLSGQAPWVRRDAENSKPQKIRHVGGLLGLFWLLCGLGNAPGLMTFALASALAGGVAYSAVIAVSLGNFIGRLVAGFLSDRIGTGPILRSNCGLLIAGCVLLVFARNSWLAELGLLVIGLQYGSLATLMPLTVRAGVPVQIFGRCYSVVFSAWGLAGLVAPVLGAALISLGDERLVIYAMLICGLLSWLTAMVILRRLPML